MLLCELTAARIKVFALVILGILLAQTVSATDDGKLTSVKPNAETSDGWGLAKATPNPISGVVLGIDGKPASLASVHVKANLKSGIDATVQADESGKFEFVVRFNSEALPQLQISASSHDKTQAVLHRFAREAKDRVTEGIELKLQTLRKVEVVVVDRDGSPVENARVAVQLGWPHILQGFETDRTGLATLQLPEQERIGAVVAWKDHVGLDYRVYSLNRNQKADVNAVPPEFPKDRAERLVLEGVSPLTIRTVDDADKPLAGVSVYPRLLYKGDDRKELNLSFLSDLFSQETDASGETILQWFPAWHKKLLTISTNVDGYEGPRGNYDPKTGDGTLAIRLNRLVPIRGQVLDEVRKPALGVKVVAHGVGRSHNQFYTFSRTDADGRYELLVAPNQIYIVCVQDSKWAATAQTGFAVLPNQPIEGRDFQLRKPTRVYGRLLNELTKDAIPNEQVIVYHYGTALHELPDVTLPNPENERRVLSPIVQHYAHTNELGEFEFFLGDGKFDIRPPQQERSEKFEISVESELELTVTTKVQPEVELVGLVVRKDNLQPVVGAKVYGVPRSFRGNDWEAESGVDGKFKVKHNARPTYVYATNADKSLVGVAEIPDTRLAIVVQLEPAGSARGRVINDAKEPVVGQRIDYGIDVPDEENRTWSTRYTGYKELMKPIRDGAQGGIPWFAILDASGQKLATSNDLKTGENIGFPFEESGQIHFANMLNTTRQRMTEQEVESLIKSTTDIAK